MGRRKIEIRPIKDDRNRSVTFLKRKGGLFKKAYELGVLCSVDVAVIIFGHNKKLYEFSSGDINETIQRYQYYAGAHEHKGPEDFAGKGGGDEDEDEDVEIGSPPPEMKHSPPDPIAHAPHHLHHQQPSFHHVRRVTPSASPPLPNGSMPMQRRGSPQPGGVSRPSSRAAIPRRPSNLAPPQYTPPQAQMAQAGYGYASHQQYYTTQHQQPLPSPQPPQTQQQQQPVNVQRISQPGPQYANSHNQMQQAYLHDQRRQSLPPGFQQHQHQQQQHQQLQQSQPQPQSLPQQQHSIPPPQPSPQPHLHPQDARSQPGKHSSQANDGYNSPPMPQPRPMAVPNKNHSIFTPIEQSTSLLAQHWGQAPSDVSNQDPPSARSQSIDVGAMSYERAGASSPRSGQGPQQSKQYPPPPPIPARSNSSSSVPSAPPTARSNTFGSDARRPRLKVQIPSEASEAGDGDSSGKETSVTSSQTAQPAKGVVLPPPSPSAGNPLLSAGATGPPNPFARPAPPATQSVNRDLETPLSALPSRVMEGNMLPSPSDIWGNMFSRSNNDNMMPSPLNFQPTPIAGNGASFKDEGDERKRRADGELLGSEKRVRT
ncbi:hypothetical protein K461DRAFT_319340 [Myriangium duriaei CBS 260.36]|uniref:MADS-box domain-containing protein n=1 Tax=Myriangium duriaei CBS 260.36 TaxID=1168546 RepID=A0A9P4MJ03_9PEZI|nr:hypothetical protein K461DRAFT_319340 [Myriangium duriaei CBS 260.36]